MRMTSVELCAGAGGQALGLEQAGFSHLSLIEKDKFACSSLRANRPGWRVIEGDLTKVSAEELVGSSDRDRTQRLDLLAGGIPCPPFSVAGKGLGKNDERDLFPAVLKLVGALQPRALMIENVKGLLASRFDTYRADIASDLKELGLKVVSWRTHEASHHGVPQRRSRSVLIAMEASAATHFEEPRAQGVEGSVGDALLPFLKGWSRAEAWAAGAQGLAPTLVGGSSKHGGADLGPTGAKRAWGRLGVDGRLIADSLPSGAKEGPLFLTVELAAILQGFPVDWRFIGGKTTRYRQVGNAFPPPVARAIGEAICRALSTAKSSEAVLV